MPSHGLKHAFQVGLPAIDLFPHEQWATLVVQHARRMANGQLYVDDLEGSAGLRHGIARHLETTRGFSCNPDQIIITGGYQSALTLVLQLTTLPGDAVWIEDPGYPRTWRAIQHLGGRPVPVTVDEDGMRLEDGIHSHPDAAVCVTAPGSQFPLGVQMAESRRRRLLEWAHSANAWVVEDDYDGDFLSGPDALPALKAMDAQDRVFYVGSFSKTLFPSLHLGYVVTPKAQVRKFTKAARDLGYARPGLDQAVLAHFFLSGRFVLHVAQMRLAYQTRRTAALKALREQLGEVANFSEGRSYFNTIGWLETSVDDRALQGRARAAGFMVLAYSRTAYTTSSRRGLILGLCNIPETEAQRMVSKLALAVQP